MFLMLYVIKKVRHNFSAQHSAHLLIIVASQYVATAIKSRSSHKEFFFHIAAPQP